MPSAWPNWPAARQITPDNARFFAAPVPVVLHIISITLYAILGAFQVTPAFRRSWPAWHRMAGRLLIPSGFVVALTGLWMAHFYPWPAFDGFALYVIRLVVGFAMTAFLLLGVVEVTRRNHARHGAWMLRAYALGMGAGMQVVTHIPWMLFPGMLNELTRTISMAAGWAIMLALAEWVIRTRRLA